nr:peroxide stress protein YaaA [uncultured Undibacterium sp.]
MLILLSPAKSLDFETPALVKTSSEPVFVDETAYLSQLAANLSVADLQSLMSISTNLAELNFERFANMRDSKDTMPTRQAVFLFDGDVYDGLQARQLPKKEVTYLQSHLRILSGLYGILRPLDTIQAYRLEMGTGLKNSAGNNLYAYWREKLSAYLKQELSATKSKFLVNLASEEYAKAVKINDLGLPVIHPIFQDYSAGKFKVVSFFAKRARGSMVRYCAVNQIRHPEKLKNFDLDGYRFIEEESNQTHWVYRRNQ